MSSEIIHIVAYDNYDDFQHVNFIFSQIFISPFWGLFNDETNLRIRYFAFYMFYVLLSINGPCTSTSQSFKILWVFCWYHNSSVNFNSQMLKIWWLLLEVEMVKHERIMCIIVYHVIFKIWMFKLVHFKLWFLSFYNVKQQCS